LSLLEDAPKEKGGRSLLVVDDEAMIRDLVVKIFEPDGFRVLTADSVDAAVEVLASSHVSVIIIDKNLAGERDGIDLLAHLSANSHRAKSIVLTGYASVESAIQAIRLGAFDYLTKPLDIEELREKVLKAHAAWVHDRERSDSESRHETLFETVPGLVWFMTDNGILKRINSDGAALLGYSEDELVGQSYEVLLANPSDAPQVHWAFKERRTKQRATRRQVVELKTRDGETRIFEVYSSGKYQVEEGSSTSPGRFLGTVGVAHDITEQIALQEQLQQAQRMEALGRLASGVAHDFNNLLGVVLSNVEFLRTSSPNGSLPRELAQIEEVATRACKMVQRILSFCSKQPAQTELLDVAEVVTSMEDLVKRLLGSSTSLRISSQPDRKAVMCDRTQLEQVILNLAVNARDAMPNGGILTINTATVAFEERQPAAPGTPPAGEYVALSVSDTGIGMTDAVRSQALEPFFTTKAKGKGRGLGLATVFGIARQHGGVVDISSRLGRGTTVAVYFPTRRAAKAAVAPAPREQDAVTSGSVLVVEDDDVIRRALGRTLGEAGYAIIEAANGAEAARIWEATGGQIQLLVTDLLMPEVSGAELAHELRRTRPDLPIVFVSGQLDEDQARLSAFGNGVRFLRKPIPRDKLLATVRSLLESRE